MSNRPIRTEPSKPFKDFPLFAHLSGQWAKKIKGKVVYFGRWEDWEGALARYRRERDDLHLGLTPQREDGYTVKDMVNGFLSHKLWQKDTGEVSERTFDNYKNIGVLIANTLGRTRLVTSLQPEDFAKLRLALGSKAAPNTLKVKIGFCKSFFAWALRNENIPRAPRYGDAFNKPSKLAIRKARAQKPKRLLTPDQIRSLIAKASVRYRAAVWLGINAALGNSDIAELQHRHLDLKNGWLHYPRPKTGIQRRCPLWPETVQALREAIAARHAPQGPGGWRSRVSDRAWPPPVPIQRDYLGRHRRRVIPDAVHRSRVRSIGTWILPYQPMDDKAPWRPRSICFRNWSAPSTTSATTTRAAWTSPIGSSGT